MDEKFDRTKLSSYFVYFLGPKGRVVVCGGMVLISLILSVKVHYLLQITFYFVFLLVAMINWDFLKYRVRRGVYFLIHCMVVLLVIVTFYGQILTNRVLGSPDSVAALCAYFLVVNEYDNFVVCGTNGSGDIYMVRRDVSEEDVKDFFIRKERLPLEIRSRENALYKELWFGERYVSDFRIVQKERVAVVLYEKET